MSRLITIETLSIYNSSGVKQVLSICIGSSSESSVSALGGGLAKTDDRLSISPPWSVIT